MSFIRYVFLGCLALALLVLALANRDLVTLQLMPDEMGLGMGLNAGITLPLFVVIFAAIALGLLIGFVWEWLREHKHRAEAARQRAAREKLEKQLAKAKPAEGDDVLALLDSPN